jgi:hypothetical protein
MKRILISVLSVALLAGCGSSGGGSSSDSSGNGGSNAGPGNPPPANNQISGCFVDNPVAGLSYRSGNGSGLTSAEGCYTAAGTIDFLIGDILLGSAAVGDFITPVDLVPGAGNEADPAANARVTNLSRLLQTLDAAANTANGIQLSEQARAAGTGRRRWQTEGGAAEGPEGSAPHPLHPPGHPKAHSIPGILSSSRRGRGG